MNNSAANQLSNCFYFFPQVSIFNLDTPTRVFGRLETREIREEGSDAGRKQSLGVVEVELHWPAWSRAGVALLQRTTWSCDGLSTPWSFLHQWELKVLSSTYLDLNLYLGSQKEIVISRDALPQAWTSGELGSVLRSATHLFHVDLVNLLSCSSRFVNEKITTTASFGLPCLAIISGEDTITACLQLQIIHEGAYFAVWQHLPVVFFNHEHQKDRVIGRV